MPKVSVVIPAYNAMLYLPETLDSVLAQSFSDYEVVIVNDGSADDIIEWANTIIDPRVTFIHQKNQGVSAARNAGIAQSQGEYIAFLDSDDLWDITKLQKQVQLLDENPDIGLVYTWILNADKQGKSTGRMFKYHYQGHVWEPLLLRNFIACGSTPMVRRGCFDQVGTFDTNFQGPEDTDMWIRIAKVYKFAVIKEPLVFYRQLDNSVSRNLLRMDEGMRLVTEKALADAPSYLTPRDLRRLYGKSSALRFTYLSWRALQSKEIDYQLADSYRRKALSHDPSIVFSGNFLRLSAVMLVARLLGLKVYKDLRFFAYDVRGKKRRLG